MAKIKLETKYKFPEKDSAWSPKNFSDFYKDYVALSQIDLNTAKGLKEYEGITPSAARWDRETTQTSYDQLTRAAGSGLRGFTLENLANVLNLADNNTLIGLALQNPSFKRGKEKYDAVAKAVDSYQDISVRAEKDPQGLIVEALDGLPKSTQAYFASFADQILQAETAYAQRQATLQVMKYGAKTYVQENVGRMKELADGAESRIAKVTEKIAKAIEAKETASGKPLAGSEKAEIQERIFKENEKGITDYANARNTLPKVVDRIGQGVYSFREHQKKQKEAEKEAKAKKAA